MKDLVNWAVDSISKSGVTHLMAASNCPVMTDRICGLEVSRKAKMRSGNIKKPVRLLADGL